MGVTIMLSNIKEIKTDNYTWIDILNPAKSELNTIAEKYNLNYFLVVDSLEFGHLPKIEKLTNRLLAKVFLNHICINKTSN
jgi:Mg2+ and Co2+ transporter CorA